MSFVYNIVLLRERERERERRGEGEKETRGRERERVTKGRKWVRQKGGWG